MRSQYVDYFIYALLPYDLKVVGVVKLSDTTYKIKCKEMDVVVKMIDASRVELIEKISTLRLPYFEQVILNQRGKAVTNYCSDYFYVVLYRKSMSYPLENPHVYLGNILAALHSQSAIVANVENGYFEKWKIYFTNAYESFIQQDHYLISTCIHEEFPPPALFCYSLSEEIGKYYLTHFPFIIKQFQALTENRVSLRKCINWGHFGKGHFDLSSQTLLGLHHVEETSPVFDLVNWFYENNEDGLISCFKKYFSYFPLEPYEAYFFLSLCFSNIHMKFDQNEFQNVSLLIYYQKKIKQIVALEEILGIDISSLQSVY
ncbi:MAG: hypothetical protein IKL88_05620 [Erysipelotrichales bacterium]|nr:hypothetical protein [Erysipelotrichales bacterium]